MFHGSGYWFARSREIPRKFHPINRRRCVGSKRKHDKWATKATSRNVGNMKSDGFIYSFFTAVSLFVFVALYGIALAVQIASVSTPLEKYRQVPVSQFANNIIMLAPSRIASPTGQRVCSVQGQRVPGLAANMRYAAAACALIPSHS